MRTLTLEEAKAYYDSFGAKQDSQTFYEGPAIKELIANSHFDQASSVFEFGCGTGRFAQELLREHLPQDAIYQGTDVSSTMIQLAKERLESFGPRAMLTQSFTNVDIPIGDNSIDRFVSTYVFDLLPVNTSKKVLDEAHRALQAEGLLCLVSIAPGDTFISNVVMSSWQWIFSQKPSIVGGCRPIKLTELLSVDRWRIRYESVVVAWGIASEVVVATPIKV
ncbi:MAG: class I SAM-dependent methyltransferase [Anaerolineales bacterium]|jgi:ubiquinone/menaquinone biosynthesis C-methylase UbiE